MSERRRNMDMDGRRRNIKAGIIKAGITRIPPVY